MGIEALDPVETEIPGTKTNARVAVSACTLVRRCSKRYATYRNLRLATAPVSSTSTIELLRIFLGAFKSKCVSSAAYLIPEAA